MPIRGYSSARKKLEEMSKSYEIKEKEETFVLPEGLSEEFYLKSNALKSVAEVKFESLIEIFRIAKTEQEVSLSKDTFANWLQTGMLSRTNSGVFFELLFETNKGLLFEFLCNRFKYALFPTSEQITTLLQHYSLEFIQSLSLDNLDMVYRTFALLLYYDIPPTLDHYHYLIASGLYSTQDEAVRRSLVTMKEVESLGWTLLPKTKVALAYHHLKKQEHDTVLFILRDIDTKTALGMRIEAFVCKGDYTEAEKLLLNYRDSPDLQCAIGRKFQRPVDEIEKILEK
jgi:Arc/MetJ-type ribon-helix-helix transcriptional regulator